MDGSVDALMKSPLQKISGSVARVERKCERRQQSYRRDLMLLQARMDALERFFRR